MDHPNLEAPRARHLLRVGVVLVALVLLLQSGGVRGEAEARHGRRDWKIESVLQEQRSGDQSGHGWLGRWFGKLGTGEEGECEEKYGILPCSESLGGSAFLLVAYGYMLYQSAILLSEGSELLLTVMSPGLIGGLVLPVLEAVPDSVLIMASGLGGTQAEAQEEVLVGMGLLAGSSVLVLTVLWGACIIFGRCDLVPHPTTGQLVAKDRTFTKGFHLTETGVSNDQQTKWASWIMMATLVPYLVAQIPRLFGLNTEGHFFIAIAAVLAVLGLCGYFIYQIMAPSIQERRIMYAQHRYRRNHALHKASHFSKYHGWGSLFKPNGEPDEEVLMKLFGHFDPDNDGHLTRQELKGLILGLGVERQNGEVPHDDELKHWMAEFDISNDGKISSEEFLQGMKHWMKSSTSRKIKSSPDIERSHSGHWDTEAQTAKLDLALFEEEADEEDEEEENERPSSRAQIKRSAVLKYMIPGVALAVIFADPFVGAIGGFSKASGISPFFISFVATPLATSFSEAIHFHASSKQQRKKLISMAYSQIYGAQIMRNTLCLGVFLAIVYFRQLVWDFSAEVVVIFFATMIMGCVVAVRTTFPLWMALFALALYPLSIALVAFLDYVCGWH